MNSFPLIAAQPGIYVADQLSSFPNAYIVVHFLEMKGDLDLNVLFAAIKQGMQEFDTLRMVYKTDRRGDTVQVLGDDSVLPEAEYIDLRSDSSSAISKSEEIMQEDMSRPCRVGSETQLIRHIVMCVGEGEYRWYQRFHHIQLDAYSFTALTRRIGTIYSVKKRGLDITNDTVLNGSSAPRPFSDAVDEYMKYEASQKYSKDAEFWRKFCSELPEAASICPRPLAGVEPTKNIIRNHIMLKSSDFKKLTSEIMSKAKNISHVDVALALISVWLLRLSNRDEMSTGFIFMRRLGSVALNTSGPFINVLPLPVHLKQYLVEVATGIALNLRSIRKHQKYNSENIVRESKRSWDSNPLFGPVINFKAFDYNLDFDNVDVTTHHVASGPVRDLELVIYINEESSVRVEYLANASRYTADGLNNDLERLQSLLTQFSVDPEADCYKTNMMLPQELKLLEDINETDHVLSGPFNSSSRSLMDLVVHQTELTPSATALVDESEEFKNGLSYHAMLSEVVQFAKHLVSMGAKRGYIIAVALTRSAYLSLAIQAISLLGASWLPLDPNYPWDRLKLMIDDARPSLIVTNSSVCNEGNLHQCGVPLVLYDKKFSEDSLVQDISIVEAQKFLQDSTSEDRAYIIYTSGSTGKPKGVVVGQVAIVNRLLWMREQYNIGVSDSVLQKTSVCFDVSVWEFFLPIITGAKLVMAPPDAHRDPSELKRLILEHGITTIHFVPSMLSTFLADTLEESNSTSGWANSLKRAFCSGEALSSKSAHDWNNVTRVPLYNLYGPTEAAIDVTYAEATPDCSHLFIPIGLPVWNTKMHVLDRNMEYVPFGVSGDLYISGIQLADEYLNLPQLTNERFITHRGVRMYKTGDIARWLNGVQGLEFLGRSDDQVKLRGQRLELGEIDAVLESLEGVSQSVTLALQNPHQQVTDMDSRQLVSYYVGSPQIAQRLSSELSQKLPQYMVPFKLIAMEKLPIGASGKLNKRSLPSPFQGETEEGKVAQKRKPAPGIEEKVAQAFQDIIQCGQVYAEDDFFSLGGHSLMAVKLATHLRNMLGLPVTIGQIMQHPRVDVLSAQLSDLTDVDQWKDAGFEDVMHFNGDASSKSDSSKKILYCIHPASGFTWQFSVLSRYLSAYEWDLVGIQSARKDGCLGTSQTLDEVVAAHLKTLLRIHPSGKPFYLIGYSLGGVLAHSLASELTKLNYTVKFLGLLDTWPPETQNWNAKLERNEVDTAVIEEMEREREQFLSASQSGDTTSQRMFDVIETNYASAVNILATAKSSKFNGTSTLFVADKTLPANTDLQEVWRPFTSELREYHVNCSHVDIVSPVVFQHLGPLIREAMQQD